jgi:hypothetical protein
MHSRSLWTYLFCLSLFGHGVITFGQELAGESSLCGPLHTSGQYGPYDFRTDKDKLPIVINYHFGPNVENLIRGQSSTAIGADIAFTLRAIPNHPNALMSMMLLGEKEKSETPIGSQYTVECWFDRALRFRPDDYVTRMIYTSFLTKRNRRADALRQLDFILANAKDNPFTYNNVGLLYFDLGEYQQALAQAHKSMELGLDRPALRDKLKAIGKWSEPVIGGSGNTSSEPASSPASAALKP